MGQHMKKPENRQAGFPAFDHGGPSEERSAIQGAAEVL